MLVYRPHFGAQGCQVASECGKIKNNPVALKLSSKNKRNSHLLRAHYVPLCIQCLLHPPDNTWHGFIISFLWLRKPIFTKLFAYIQTANNRLKSSSVWLQGHFHQTTVMRLISLLVLWFWKIHQISLSHSFFISGLGIMAAPWFGPKEVLDSGVLWTLYKEPYLNKDTIVTSWFFFVLISFPPSLVLKRELNVHLFLKQIFSKLWSSESLYTLKNYWGP